MTEKIGEVSVGSAIFRAAISSGRSGDGRLRARVEFGEGTGLLAAGCALVADQRHQQPGEHTVLVVVITVQDSAGRNESACPRPAPRVTCPSRLQSCALPGGA